MKIIKLFILILIFIVFSPKALALQTIFNVPSADVTEKGHVFVLDSMQTTPWETKDAFYNTVFSSYGIGHNTDIDFNLYNVGSPATNNISISVGFKTSVPVPILKEKFPKREIKITAGSNVAISLQGNGVGNWTYAHLSGRLPKLNTRLTAGISYGTRQIFGVEKTAFIAGVEQPITEKFVILGDWFSGSEHWAGYLIVGGHYKLPKDTHFFFGYQIPNSSRVGSAGFIFQIAKNF